MYCSVHWAKLSTGQLSSWVELPTISSSRSNWYPSWFPFIRLNHVICVSVLTKPFRSIPWLFTVITWTKISMLISHSINHPHFAKFPDHLLNQNLFLIILLIWTKSFDLPFGFTFNSMFDPVDLYDNLFRSIRFSAIDWPCPSLPLNKLTWYFYRVIQMLYLYALGVDTKQIS